MAWYVADFETTTKNYYDKYGTTKVWLYAICDENGNIVNQGKSIEEFIVWCKSNNKANIYFHNLKFDGSFILNYLLRNGFHYVEKLRYKDSKGFSTLIGQEGQYYQITVNFASCKQVKFFDSLKIIPLKVAQIAKAFNLPIQKLSIDYSKYDITQRTLNYVYNDVKIVAKGLKFFKDMNLDRMTIGSIAYNLFLKETPVAEKIFPVLDRDFLKKWRDAYRGGRTQVNPKYANKKLFNVKRFDINSMYPYTMSRKPMPYGNPIKLAKQGTFKFELYEVDIWFKLKDGHLPTLLKNASMFNSGHDSYYYETDNIETILISNIDLELVYRHYDIKYIEFKEMWGFKTVDFIFRPFIDKYYELKNNSTGGLKLLFKLIINNLYGKYGSKCEGKTKIPKLEDNILAFTDSEMQEMRLYYLPVAIAITSHCHMMIDDAIMATGYDNFVYCDTDSVHTIGDLPKEMIDNKEIGKFKFEGTEIMAKYVRQKCYVYRELNKKSHLYETHITCAGMTDGIKEYLVDQYKYNVFNIFDVGLTVDENSHNIKEEQLKLRPMQVCGGTILTPTTFSLK